MTPGEPIEVRILKSEQVIQQEALKGVISLLVVAGMVAVQWWATTPEPERMLRLRKFGISRCSQKRWHFRQGTIAYPRHCFCQWEGASPAAQRLADMAERRGAKE